MSDFVFDVSLADIAAYDWEGILARADHPVCSLYETQLTQESIRLSQSGDQRGERVFRFLAAIASMTLTADDNDSPYSPAFITGCHRSLAIDDLSATELNILSELLPKTGDAAMRARFGDVLWVVRKDHKCAKIAAEAYLENFGRLDRTKGWTWDRDAFRRGFGLARLLGRENEPFPSYVAHTERLIDARASSEHESLCAMLMEMLLEQEAGDWARHAAAAERIAHNIEKGGNYFLAQQYLEIAAKLYLFGKQGDAARRIRLEKGESLVRQAGHVVKDPKRGYLLGSHFLALGIECLRRSQAPQETVARLHKLLREWQGTSLKEVQVIEHEVDISECVRTARSRVQGKDLRDAIFSLALGHRLVKISELKERVIKNAGKFPFAHFMQTTLISHDGRVLARRPPVVPLGGDASEIAMDAEMISQAREVDWPLRVSAYIEPCREVIYREHRPSRRDLAFLVEDNPFVPPGHEALFLRGIHAGFHYDMLVAAHCLVPQVEESIRYVLRQVGVTTSKLDSDSGLVQEERLLGTLLSMPQTTKVFGEAYVFELRGALCEKFGFDLRNRLAHGFLTESECYGADVVLVWWLVLRLCAYSVLRAVNEQVPTGDAATEEAGGSGEATPSS